MECYNIKGMKAAWWLHQELAEVADLVGLIAHKSLSLAIQFDLYDHYNPEPTSSLNPKFEPTITWYVFIAFTVCVLCFIPPLKRYSRID